MKTQTNEQRARKMKNLTLGPDTHERLARLRGELGISESAVVERALRLLERTVTSDL